MREVVAIRSGIVPDFVGVPDFRNGFSDFSGPRIDRQTADRAARRHQATVWPGGQAAERQIEHAAFALHGKTLDRIGKFVRIEHVDAIPGAGHILIEPSGIAIPDRLLHAILVLRIIVVAQQRTIGNGNEREKRRRVPVVGSHQDFIDGVIC